MTETRPEWETEPESKSFEHAGMRCELRRGPESIGHWCGYVEVPTNNLYYKASYDAPDVRVHGGLTYAGNPHWDKNDTKSEWFGFDCAHAGDLCPGMTKHNDFNDHSDVYRNIAYVEAETRSLAEQLAKFNSIEVEQ